jgi:quercetin dioxygenase-like cupin family protein
MSSIEYLRIFSDSDGRSHVDTSNIDLKMNDYAPPATPLNTSPLESATAMVFLELSVGWFGDWHPSPVKQWLFLLKGECEFETGDGERCRRKAGEAVLLDDTMGKGHRARVVGDIPVLIAAVHCT